MTYRHWTAAADARLRREYPTGDTAALARVLRRSENAIGQRAQKLGIAKTAHWWTPAQDRELRRLYPDTPTPEVATKLGRSVSSLYGRIGILGLKKSAEFVARTARDRTSRPDHPSRQYRYSKGHVPANKGLRRPGYAPGRMAETQFKAGERGSRWVPIGSTRVVDGYHYTKVRDVRSTKSGRGFVPYTVNWKPTHHLLWKKHGRRIPPNHVLVFKNGDRMDIRLGNLELISRGDNVRRNSIHRMPPDLKKTVYALIALKGTITRRTKREGHQRSEGTPVRHDRAGKAGHDGSGAREADRRRRPRDRRLREGRGRGHARRGRQKGHRVSAAA